MIVADATPLIHLARANWLRLLRRLYERVVVPPSVWQEVLGPVERRPEAHVLVEAAEEWIEARELSAKAARRSSARSSRRRT